LRRSERESIDILTKLGLKPDYTGINPTLLILALPDQRDESHDADFHLQAIK
jgi:hypothetical protein